MSDPKYFSGQGKVYAAPRGDFGGTVGAFEFLGNCPDFTVTPITNPDEHIRDPADQAYDREQVDVTRLLGLKMVIEDFKAANWARVMYAAGKHQLPTQKEETIYIERGKYQVLSHINITNLLYVKTIDGTFTYNLTTPVDLILSPTGSVFIPEDSAIPDRSYVKIKYEHDSYDRYDSFSKRPPDLWVRLEGLNTVNGDQVVADAYFVRIPLADSLPLINETLAVVTLNCQVFGDGSKPLAERFMRVRIATPGDMT